MSELVLRFYIGTKADRPLVLVPGVSGLSVPVEVLLIRIGYLGETEVSTEAAVLRVRHEVDRESHLGCGGACRVLTVHRTDRACSFAASEAYCCRGATGGGAIPLSRPTSTWQP